MLLMLVYAIVCVLTATQDETGDPLKEISSFIHKKQSEPLSKEGKRDCCISVEELFKTAIAEDLLCAF